MDLIDRSKLKRTEGMFQYQINDAFDRLSASAYKFEDVENAPTVEAIPVEWVRKYMDGLPDGGMAYECILVMLEDWRKENE